jgi:uncharacterized glyoxalase superfamily protein PhnB
VIENLAISAHFGFWYPLTFGLANQTTMKLEKATPNIFVKDMNATIDFYQKLGFTLTNSVKSPEGTVVWAQMDHGAVTFMFQTFTSIDNLWPQVSRTDGGSLLLYIDMKGIREFYDKIKTEITLLTGLEKTFYGATEFSLCDNNNYLLTFAEHE